MVQEIDSKVIEVLPIPYEDISQAATEASDKFVYEDSNEVRRLFSLIPFSLEDRYQILPKMIPWDFPSWLSELVEKEITMLLCMMEKSGVFTEVIEDKFDDKDIQNYFEKHIYEIDSIEAKKKAMLSKNCFDHDSILQTPSSILSEKQQENF
ncbi:hypothetical protein GH714_001518 [Hevea brasiliensis]|uniref:Uncharacterized protein n=1 Tax=Hevea brasiliensis TaxID=3981 RepID=A0A6A6L8F8_HEVBR|nr:hypothetical protein GH714_001518 [Hevea brasiliensis]